MDFIIDPELKYCPQCRDEYRAEIVWCPACGGGCCGADLVFRVRKDDAPDVMVLLDREHVQSTCLADYDTSYVDAVFNADAEETTCPACGCRFSTQQAICPDCGLCFA